jgi:hypothetical protein
MVASGSRTHVNAVSETCKKEPKMNLSDFYNALEAHDWYFDYSDDHSVWKRGVAARDALVAASKESPEHTALFKAYREHMFTGKPWGNEKAPKPVRPV